MFSQRILGRFSQRAGQQMRSAPVRSTIQRRANSTEANPSWIVDNEFNRERAAVKHHAASTSGQLHIPFRQSGGFVTSLPRIIPANPIVRSLAQVVPLVRYEQTNCCFGLDETD